MPAAGPPCAPNTAEPATSTRATGLDNQGRRVRLDPTVHFQVAGLGNRIDHLPHPADLGQRARNELLSAEAGVHGHHQHQFHFGQDFLEHRRRRRRIDRHAGALAQRVNGLHRPVQVNGALLVHDHRVGAGFCKRFEITVGLGDHQVNFKGDRAQRPEPAHDHRPERNIRDEMPVHDVDMNPIGSRGDNLLNLVRQVGQIGRKDRRCQLDRVLWIVHGDCSDRKPSGHPGHDQRPVVHRGLAAR